MSGSNFKMQRTRLAPLSVKDCQLKGDFGVSLEFNVRRLRVEDAGPLVALRREALETDPMAFGSSIADDRGLSVEPVRFLVGGS